MKKIPKLLLTLIPGLITTIIPIGQASALYIDEDNVTWYTVSELLDYKEEIDAKVKEECGDNRYCLEEFYFGKTESEDRKFEALRQLTDMQITVTAVNPSEETLKILFFDEDMMMRSMGIYETLTLGEFYMGWFEYDVERIYNYTSYTEELFNDTMPGAHLIYAQENNDGDKIPANREFEITVKGSNLALNTSGEIGYGVFANPYFNAMGRFIYTSCLEEPDYEEGKECRLMFSGEKGFRYFPPRETILKSNQSDNLLIMESEIVLEDEVTMSEGEEGNDQLEFEQEKELPQDKIIVPKAPNTGTYTSPCNQKTIEFPWWLMVLIALGDVVVLWIFWPKARKNPKKTLDKKTEVR